MLFTQNWQQFTTNAYINEDCTEHY